MATESVFMGKALIAWVIGVGVAIGAGGYLIKDKEGRPLFQTLLGEEVDEPERGPADRDTASQPDAEPGDLETAAETPAQPDSAAIAGAPVFDLLRVETDGSVVIAGNAAPNSAIEILKDGEIEAEGSAGLNGDFAIVLETPLPPGDHEIQLRATPPGGEAPLLSAETGVVSIPDPDSDEGGDVLAMIAKPGEATRIVQTPDTLQQEEPAAGAATEDAEGETETASRETPAPSEEPAEQQAAAETDTTADETADGEAVAEAGDGVDGDDTVIAEAEPPATPGATLEGGEDAADSMDGENLAALPETTPDGTTPDGTPPDGTPPDATPSPELPAAESPAPESPDTGDGEAVAALDPESGAARGTGEAPDQADGQAAAPPASPDAEPAVVERPVLLQAVDVENERVFIAGTGTPGYRVNLYLNNAFKGTATIGPEGAFLFEMGEGMQPGRYDLRADMLAPSTSNVVSRAAVIVDHQPETETPETGTEEQIAAATPESEAPPSAEVPVDSEAESAEPPLVEDVTPLGDDAAETEVETATRQTDQSTSPDAVDGGIDEPLAKRESQTAPDVSAETPPAGPVEDDETEIARAEIEPPQIAPEIAPETAPAEPTIAEIEPPETPPAETPPAETPPAETPPAEARPSQTLPDTASPEPVPAEDAVSAVTGDADAPEAETPPAETGKTDTAGSQLALTEEAVPAPTPQTDTSTGAPVAESEPATLPETDNTGAETAPAEANGVADRPETDPAAGEAVTAAEKPEIAEKPATLAEPPTPDEEADVAAKSGPAGGPAVTDAPETAVTPETVVTEKAETSVESGAETSVETGVEASGPSAPDEGPAVADAPETVTTEEAESMAAAPATDAAPSADSDTAGSDAAASDAAESDAVATGEATEPTPPVGEESSTLATTDPPQTADLAAPATTPSEAPAASSEDSVAEDSVAQDSVAAARPETGSETDAPQIQPAPQAAPAESELTGNGDRPPQTAMADPQSAPGAPPASDTIAEDTAEVSGPPAPAPAETAPGVSSPTADAGPMTGDSDADLDAGLDGYGDDEMAGQPSVMRDLSANGEPAGGTDQMAAISPDDSPSAETPVIRTGRSVIIRRGDSLWRVSRRMLGKGRRYTFIFAANQDQIENPHLIYPGQVFDVPDQETAEKRDDPQDPALKKFHELYLRSKQ